AVLGRTAASQQAEGNAPRAQRKGEVPNAATRRQNEPGPHIQPFRKREGAPAPCGTVRDRATPPSLAGGLAPARSDLATSYAARAWIGPVASRSARLPDATAAGLWSSGPSVIM
ncbi:hypothetical protein, partial [Mesorhizobium sp. M5C.F.Ca.IN.020.29.1.1]|uniref:hypothetical protein n=1 Tax=Mesorhizobium sp. M5C.F.Ca.IN.020.29.1.1 TaxID=2496770 RepID=UPI0019D1DC3C